MSAPDPPTPAQQQPPAGWWQAGDGRWYPPGTPPTEAGTPPEEADGRGEPVPTATERHPRDGVRIPTYAIVALGVLVVGYLAVAGRQEQTERRPVVAATARTAAVATTRPAPAAAAIKSSFRQWVAPALAHASGVARAMEDVGSAAEVRDFDGVRSASARVATGAGAMSQELERAGPGGGVVGEQLLASLRQLEVASRTVAACVGTTACADALDGLDGAFRLVAQRVTEAQALL